MGSTWWPWVVGDTADSKPFTTVNGIGMRDMWYKRTHLSRTKRSSTTNITGFQGSESNALKKRMPLPCYFNWWNHIDLRDDQERDPSREREDQCLAELSAEAMPIRLCHVIILDNEIL
ncbi:hypothetical protein J6590_092644 [Homalodisca vitripennis]|nr:hypothetical protein J6590_092644 [Homalodisca vitripennis]